MDRYRFLLFDLDRTLLDFDADEAMAFEKLYAAQGWDKAKPYSPEMLALYDGINARWWRLFEQKECTKQQLFTGRFVEFLNAAGLTGDPVQINDRYFAFLGSGGVAYPGALDLLHTLSQTADLYVITNGNAATAKTRIVNSGVLPYVRDYFVSETIGHAKPAKEYFDYVAAHIPGFEKDRAIVIGDSPVSDLQGALNAGLDSLWYHPEEVPGGSPVPFTYEARSFSDILRILTQGE